MVCIAYEFLYSYKRINFGEIRKHCAQKNKNDKKNVHHHNFIFDWYNIFHS